MIFIDHKERNPSLAHLDAYEENKFIRQSAKNNPQSEEKKKDYIKEMRENRQQKELKGKKKKEEKELSALDKLNQLEAEIDVVSKDQFGGDNLD